MAEADIGDYALVGDTRTAALISSAGSIDWMCIPTFDGQPVFGALIDDDGGRFSIELEGAINTERRYLEDSAMLWTSVDTETGSARVLEAMIANVKGRMLPQTLLVRRVTCVAGYARVHVRFAPRLGLPALRPHRMRRARQGLVCEWGSLALSLSSSLPLEMTPEGAAVVQLASGQSLTLVLSVADRCPVTWVGPDTATELLDETASWWRSWSRRLDYEGPYREAVVRSLITLRLLTYSPSGAPVAAVTTSLPEAPGAGRNWDYRYAWPRDAAIGLASFLAVGNRSLAHSFMHWLLHATRLSRPRLRVLYNVYGKPAPGEREIGVSGFQNSRPVRVGNDARTQHQLDGYGWVVDASWLLERSGHRLHGETWRALAGFADFVAAHWREPDAGIWEMRDHPAQYVHSKLMAWVALDRMTRMAGRRRVRSRRKSKWARERDAIASWIRTRGIDPQRGTLTWYAGGHEVDASLLLLPVVEFDPAGAPLVRDTIDAIRKDLEIAPGLLLRYPRRSDGLEGDEGAFLPCSFWLVQALARTGRSEEASKMFHALLSYANGVGLFSEEIDPKTKQLLGNFPQALTHAALVQAALSLREVDATDKEAT